MPRNRPSHATEFQDWLDSGEPASSSTFFLYHNWIENLSSPVVSHRPNGTLVYVNPSAARLFGKRRRDLVTSTLVDQLPQPMGPSWWYDYVIALGLGDGHIEPSADSGSRNAEVSVELDFIAQSGELVQFDVTASVQLDSKDEPGLVWMTFLDARERRRAAALIEERTKKLKESNKDLEDFAYVASHDLQEPLRKITAFSERLEKQLGDGLDDRSADYLNRVTNASARMQGLINDLLTYSRTTASTEALTPVPLSTVVTSVLGDLEVAIAEAGATISVGSLPIIDSDAVQLRQVFQNLIGNAIKFRRPDVAPEIQIEAAAFGPRWLIRVSDNGIGFDAKYVDKIFTVFQRLHGRSDYEGTGIGLAIVRKIVERHDGTIRAEVDPDRPGARFVIDLPRSRVEILNAA